MTSSAFDMIRPAASTIRQGSARRRSRPRDRSETRSRQEIAGEREERHADAEQDKGAPQPETGDGVAEHEQDRPENAELARAEMPQSGTDEPESENQHDSDHDAPIEIRARTLLPPADQHGGEEAQR